MRTAAMTVALLVLTVAPALPTVSVAGTTSCTCGGFGRYAHWADRCDPADARLGITTQGGEVTLLLTDRDVVFQLSNRTLHRVERELRDARDDQDNVLVHAFVAAVTGTVLEVLDHSVVCHVRDLRDVRYEDGRLLFIGNCGRVVLGHAHVCDTDVCEAFSERDARNFVREFRRLKAEM